MQVPILAGVYTDGSPALRIAYPVNMVPVPGQDGVADGFLRPAEGIIPFATGYGVDRGAIVWNGVHYRVSGNSLISVSATGIVTLLGTINGTGPVRMDYGFDRLGIAAGGLLYYWDGTHLTFVTDPNIGTVKDMVWVDGYFMATDGTNIVVTTLSAPDTVNPIKYGSTDEPDTIQCLLKALDQVNAVSRYEIDIFQNVGGAYFPFNSTPTALITKGCVGPRAACVITDTIAFVGSGRNEAVSVYLGANAQTVKIASIEIDNLLQQYTMAQLQTITMQTVFTRGGQYLRVNLPDRTIVYDAVASTAAQQPVWHVLTSAIDGFAQYRAQNILLANDAWVVGDTLSSGIGTLSSDDSTHWGSPVRWEFSTRMPKNGGKGVLVNQLELFYLNGSTKPGLSGNFLDSKSPRVSTAYSSDGINWSQDRAIQSGFIGDTTRRLVWLQQGQFRNRRFQRFRGDSISRLSALGVEATLEPLMY